MEVSLSPLLTQEGSLISSTIRDVTERKRMERKLEEHRLHLEKQVTARTAELALANELLQQDADVLRQSHRFVDLMMSVTTTFHQLQ